MELTERCFLLHVRDDGVGITHENAGHGHWACRACVSAQRLGAELQLWTRPGLGTEVALAVRPGGCISAADRVGIGPGVENHD